MAVIDPEELDLVTHALSDLYGADRRWKSNYIVYLRMGDNQRARWWVSAKLQAKKGTAAMNILLLKVIELRMKT